MEVHGEEWVGLGAFCFLHFLVNCKYVKIIQREAGCYVC